MKDTSCIFITHSSERCTAGVGFHPVVVDRSGFSNTRDLMSLGRCRPKYLPIEESPCRHGGELAVHGALFLPKILW
jgi:hypothetical protein